MGEKILCTAKTKSCNINTKEDLSSKELKKKKENSEGFRRSIFKTHRRNKHIRERFRNIKKNKKNRGQPVDYIRSCDKQQNKERTQTSDTHTDSSGISDNLSDKGRSKNEFK